MKTYIKGLLLVGLGIVIAVPLFLITKTTMIKTSSHANNPKGLVAGCMASHLPPLEHTLSFFIRKPITVSKMSWGMSWAENTIGRKTGCTLTQYTEQSVFDLP